MCVKPFWTVVRIVAYSLLFISLKFVDCRRAAFPRLLFHWTFLVLKQCEEVSSGDEKGILYKIMAKVMCISLLQNEYSEFLYSCAYDPWKQERYVIQYFSNLFGHGILFVKTPNKHFMLWLVRSGAQSSSSGVEFMNKKDESVCIE